MARTLKCPICSRKVSMDDPYMPFCSDRCRVADLANWADEKYSIPSGNRSNELEDVEQEPHGPHEGLLQ